MAKLLALDTSTDACSVALHLDGETQEIFRIIPRRHTHELLPMIQELLQEGGISMNQLDAVAFGRGPGSFAGIRIATGVAQGLAFAAELPVVPVSTLAALAQGAWREQQQNAYVLAAIDARMDEVYWGEYQVSAEGLTLITPEEVAAPSALHLGLISDESSDEISRIGVGSGFNYQSKMPDSVITGLHSIYDEVHPRALDIVTLAERDFAAGLYVKPDDALPVYLRNQVAWKKKDQQ